MPTVPAVPPLPARLAPEDEPLSPLSHAPVGWRRVVDSVDGPDRADLERQGLLPGRVVVVAARTPFGGPLAVELDRARVTLSSRVAAQVSTRPFTVADATVA